MASGWAQDGAVQDQIDATVDAEIERAKNSLPKGLSLTYCEECDAVIPEPRRKAIQGVRLCISCQSEQEKSQQSASIFNRSGSKDSQLR